MTSNSLLSIPGSLNLAGPATPFAAVTPPDVPPKQDEAPSASRVIRRRASRILTPVPVHPSRLFRPLNQVLSRQGRQEQLDRMIRDFVSAKEGFLAGQSHQINLIADYYQGDLKALIQTKTKHWAALSFDVLKAFQADDWHDLKNEFTGFQFATHIKPEGRAPSPELAQAGFSVRQCLDQLLNIVFGIQTLFAWNESLKQPELRSGTSAAGQSLNPHEVIRFQGGEKRVSAIIGIVDDVRVGKEEMNGALSDESREELLFQWAHNALQATSPGGMNPIYRARLIYGRSAEEALYLGIRVEAGELPPLEPDQRYLYLGMVNQGVIPPNRLKMMREGTKFTDGKERGTGEGLQRAGAIIRAYQGLAFFLSHQGFSEIGAFFPLKSTP